MVSRMLGLVFAMHLAIPSIALADPLDLATIPLANSPTVTIQPNLLFVLDDSGSMGSDYMPDTANSSNPSLFRNAAYNTIFYNPAVRYDPPAFFDAGGLNTTKYPSQTGMSADAGADTSVATPNWKKVKSDPYLSTSTSDITNNTLFFTTVAGEYCAGKDLKVCNAQSAESVAYPFAAPVRWCNTSTNANAVTPAVNSCQGVRKTGFTNLRMPSARISTITVIDNNKSGAVDGITVSGKQILSAATSSSTNSSTVANRIAQNINNCTYTMTGNCTIAGYFATVSGMVVTLYASPASATANIAVTPVISETSNKSFATTAFSVNNVPGRTLPAIIVSPNNYPYPGSATKASTRSDCGAICTFDEEMTNYANWYAYYQTRMQMMKTSAGLAFKDLGEDFRVGFMTIHPTAATSLKFDTFNTAQKAAWYSKFFGISPNSATPLRSALSKAGRIYANKENISGAFTDPIEYSCQQNFTLLTTDGYWNTDTSTDIKDVAGAEVGNRDGAGTPRPMYEGGTATSNSLADVAKYYRDTDLRTTVLGNCTGALGAPGGSVCEDPPPSTANQKQTMVTMTLGLGVDGELVYTSDYKTAASGDYSDIKNATKNWPNPITGSQGPRIDDLWHAAVNGDGTYFSAKSPTELTSQLKEALASIKIKLGSGAAASTSSLSPTAGDNFAYLASYTTGHWTGNLEKRQIDLVTGDFSATADACVEDVVPTSSCSSPSSIVANGSGGYNCVTTGATAASCPAPGVLNGTNCEVPVATACVGTLKNKVAAFTDSRVIKMKSGSSLVDFSYANLSPTQQATFQNAFLLANLTQAPTLTADQQLNVTGDNLVNYLRGQTGYDENSPDPKKKVFRKRQAVLGDVIGSAPTFVGAPTFNYTDPGYADFKTAQAGRARTVYVGSNDGMLHAFDADTLQERWAYVPSMVIPNMWKLADAAYANKHTYYVDGDAVIADICDAGCGAAGASWKTILVAGLNGGGRGYYALDITDPLNPALLWEFDANNEPNLGYTFGRPVITKKPNGTWVVLVTSGYNNIPDNSAFYSLASTKFKPNNPPLYTTGNGQGYLYLLDAEPAAGGGPVAASMATGVGSTATPSGLGKISAYVDDPARNNTSTYVYGGDLLGNIWRFNLADNTVLNFAKLEANGIAQPITTAPELGLINNKRVVFVGTGKYLEIADLTNTNQQSLYAIKDDNANSTLVNPRGTLVEQTVVPSGANDRVSGSSNAVNFDSGLGWFVDFPDVGERQNIASQLLFGTLIVPTVVPTSSACQPAGYGWFNFFDYKTGLSVPTNPSSTIVSRRTESPLVGLTAISTSSGGITIYGRGADGSGGSFGPPFQPSGVGFQKKRTIWRELTN